jgi:DNA-binding HxlR family transcriptional regulator
VEYTLTPLGRRLLPIIAQMVKFGKQFLVRSKRSTMEPGMKAAPIAN